MLPGVGVARPEHVGAVVGFVRGLGAHAVRARASDPRVHELADQATREPSRYGLDLLLATHDPERYALLARGSRLPSHLFAEHERRGTLAGHLREVHERWAPEIRRRFGHRPLAERILLGLAYGSGTVEETVRALDALRAHPQYPARASWRGLTWGLEPHHVARVASAIVPGARDPERTVEVYRTTVEGRERELHERRGHLLRRLHEKWPTRGPEIVGMWERLSRGMSPEQAETVRVELERGGDAEKVWKAVEMRNLAHRMEAVVAAFRRWLGEWEHAHDPSAQTPLQEPLVLGTRQAAWSRAARGPTTIVETSGPSDEDRPIVLGTEGAEDTADRAETGAVHAVRAPAPGAHAADGHLPWPHLTQGFGPRDHEELRHAWDSGRSWDVYRGILSRRGAESLAVREAEFSRRLQRLGFSVGERCFVDREQLALFADLGESFAPEQWARLASALQEGTADPLEVWREIECENLAEAVSIREPAFLRFLGASDRGPKWNPAEWAMSAPEVARATVDGETSGLFDAIGGALGGVIGAAGGGEGGGGDLLSSLGEGLGSVMGGAGGGGFPGAGGAADPLSGIGGALGSLFGGGGAGPHGEPGGASPLGGHLAEFAEKALGALTGRRAAPPPPPAEPHRPPPARRHDETGGVDELAEIARRWSPVLLPATLPMGADPTRWWSDLTRGQGLGETAEQVLRAAVDANGPDRIPETLALYRQLLAQPHKRLRAARARHFTELVQAGERIAGGPFDPATIPGGEAFAQLGEHAFDWPAVREAIRAGVDPIGVFQQVEAKREYQSLHAASARMHQLLDALYRGRPKSDGGDDGPDAEADTGALELVRSFRRFPRPLFHLSFGRAMERRELTRLLGIVPQLRCHPDGVLAEMAGLAGQARDVRGVDALTGEYLVREGEDLAAIAKKLVGDRQRWVELDAANPLRAEGNPRVRIPPSWFGFVPYSVSVGRRGRRLRRSQLELDRAAHETLRAHPHLGGIVREATTVHGTSLHGLRRLDTGDPDTGNPGEAGAPSLEEEAGYAVGELEDDAGYELGDEAGAVRGGGGSRRRRRRHHGRRSGTSGASGGAGSASAVALGGSDDGDDADDSDASGPVDWLRKLGHGWNPFGPSEPAPASPAPSETPPSDDPPDPSLDRLEMPGARTADGPRPNLTKRTYRVQSQDWPAKIATSFRALTRPHWLAEFERANPHKAVNSATGSWFTLNPGETVNIPDLWPAGGSDTGALEDDDAGTPRENLTKRSYAVVAGDGMQKIAQKLGASGRPHWFAELRDANPHKEMATKAGKQTGWKSLYPGEIINVPDVWPDAPEMRPAPGGVPTAMPYAGLPVFPSLPGAVPSPTSPPGAIPAAATVDPGTLLRCQAILTAWGRLYPGEIQPPDFGAGKVISPDLLSVPTARTKQAIGSFQRWSNGKAHTRLRTDGVLDPDTIAALDSFSAQALGGLAERPPVVPIPGAAPPHVPDPFPGLLGAVRSATDELTRRTGTPPFVAPLPDVREPPRATTDPWSGVFVSAARTAEEMARRGAAASPVPLPGGMPAMPPIADPLRDLPGVLQRYGAPGVPGLPGGAPHAPSPNDVRIPDVPHADPFPAPPPRAPRRRPAETDAPRGPRPTPAPDPGPTPDEPPKKNETDAVIPALLAGIGALSGVFG